MKAVLLLSGGVDSVVLHHDLEEQGYQVLPLFVNYGQAAAAQEYNAARRCGRVDLVNLLYLNGCFMRPAGYLGEDAIIPGRNAVLLSLGVSYAVANDAQRVYYGATEADRVLFPDCRLDFVSRFREVAKVYGVDVQAPYSGMTKREVLGKGEALGVDFVETWSCYSPIEGRPCFRCESCNALTKALQS